jgi:hypothetical protein
MMDGDSDVEQPTGQCFITKLPFEVSIYNLSLDASGSC